MEFNPANSPTEALPVNEVLARIINTTRPQQDIFEIDLGDGVMKFQSVNNYKVMEEISKRVALFQKAASKKSKILPQFQPYYVNDPAALASCAALAATVIEPATSEMEFMVMCSVAPLVFRYINEEWARQNNGLAAMAQMEEIEEEKKD